MALQNISINIEKIIKNNKISKEYNVIKDMEDKIVEIYQKNNDTEFLNENKETWTLKERFRNNNGFTIIERIK